MGPITNKIWSTVSYLLSESPSSPAGKIALFTVRVFSIGGLACLAFPKVGKYVWNWIKGTQPPRPSTPSGSQMHPNASPSIPAALQSGPLFGTQVSAPASPPSSSLPPNLVVAAVKAALPVLLEKPIPAPLAEQPPSAFSQPSAPAAAAAALPITQGQSQPNAPLAAASPKIKASQISILQKLAEIRDPLKKYLLQANIQLDDEDYPLPNQTDLMEKLRMDLNNQESKINELGHLFGEIALNGDAGYAHDIRTILAGYGITSYQVSKSDGKRLDSVKPYSYAQTNPFYQPVTAHASYYQPISKPSLPNDHSYLDSWGYQIWFNYHNYRKNTFFQNDRKQKGDDRPLTEAQLAHYKASFKRIEKLHKEGYLIGRVASLKEPKETAGHRPDMGNEILSTTLWPKEGSLLQMQLFCEQGLQETVGLLLDPKRVSQADFGVALAENGGTAGSSHSSIKHKYIRNSAVCLKAQHELLNAFDLIAQEGGKPSEVIYALNTDRKGWTVKQSDARNSYQPTQRRGGYRAPLSSLEVAWNEMTYYRGVSGDLLTGLFVKSDSESFSNELKNLFELQDHIRRTKGRFLPIFKFDGIKNKLTEIPPDELLLNILGLPHIPPINRESSLSQALVEAGITLESAISMSKNLPSEGTLRSLFDLQLLMFNLKDISGSVAIPDENVGTNYFTYTKIRLIDNLHLVFPTIHKTQNTTARKPDLFFSKEDIDKIKELNLNIYLAHALRYNLKRFLSITVEKDQIQFDEKILSLFDRNDAKKLDFAKVLARALQAAVLFNIFDDQTETHVKEITKVIRQKLPYLGLTPTGKDMILGSPEMQAITQNPLTHDLVPDSSTLSKPELKFESKLDFSKIFEKMVFSTKESALAFLEQFGFEKNGTIDQKKLDEKLYSDPLFTQSEGEVLKALEFLALEDESLTETIAQNLRKQIKYFGFSAYGHDRLNKKHQSILTKWIQDTKTGNTPSTEFPFQAIWPSPLPNYLSTTQIEFTGAFRVPQRGEAFKMPDEDEENPLPNITQSEALKQKIIDLIDAPKQADPRYNICKALGLLTQDDKLLCAITPTFHINSYNGQQDLHRPTAPYLTITDMLGKHAAELMTGPAMNPDVLMKNQKTVKVYFNSNIVQEGQVQRFITHTLAVTTDGDHQVVRPNGTQYCRTAYVPAGGNIQFNAGNEMYDFRRVGHRHYFKDDTTNPYRLLGGYSSKNLKDVQNYDALLLSDEERRRKSEGLILAGYITITARGGYGSPRIPLDKAHCVLFIDTCGAQFEKYKEGEFSGLNQEPVSNELEAADFIIKKGAVANKTPLILENGETPAHTEISSFNVLGDKNWSQDYVQMLDGAFFNRQAFQKATNRKLSTQVLPVIQDNLKEKPFYLKATLFGGGFFAKTKDGGDLREEVTHAMVSGYVKLIQEEKIPQGSVIEFPRYGKLDDIEPSLKEALLNAHKKGIEIVWSEEGDLCDFEAAISLSGKSVTSQAFEENDSVVLLNAGDAMSWKGNESSSASVESMIGNNSNLRAVFNWWANRRLLDSQNYKKLG